MVKQVKLDDFFHRLWECIDLIDIEYTCLESDDDARDKTSFDEWGSTISFCLRELKGNPGNAGAYILSSNEGALDLNQAYIDIEQLPDRNKPGYLAHTLAILVSQLRASGRFSFDAIDNLDTLIGYVDNDMRRLSQSSLQNYTLSYDEYKQTEADKLAEAELVRDFSEVIVKMRKKIELTEREAKTLYNYVCRFGFNNRMANDRISMTLMTLANTETHSSDSMQDPTNYCHYNSLDSEMIESFLKSQERNALVQHSMFNRAQSCVSYLVPLVMVAIAMAVARNYGDNPFVPT